jgi:hypothetical protein
MRNIPILFFGLFLLFFLPVLATAQQTLSIGQNNYENKKGIIYNKEIAFNLKLHTNGIAAGMQFGTIKTYYKTRYWGIEFGELKDTRETRQNRNNQIINIDGSFRGFIYGKQNNFYALRATFGEKRYLSEKARRKGLAVGISYSAGPTLGLLKPYYLVLRYVENPAFNNYRSEKFSSANEARFLDIDNIYGADSFAKGLGELKFLPGAHAKFAMHFDWGAFDEFVKAFEVGVMADFYLKKVPIMVESPLINNSGNQALFLNLFINFQLGKRS